MNRSDDFHCFRSNVDVHWEKIADVLDADPTAWSWALANIERWLARGRLHPAPLLEWRRLLRAGCEDQAERNALLASLREPPTNVFQDQLRSCSPFIGGPFQQSVLD